MFGSDIALSGHFLNPFLIGFGSFLSNVSYGNSTLMAKISRNRFNILLFIGFGCAATQAVAVPIDAIIVHPIYSEPYHCSEHWAGQFDYLGDSLGTDCTIEKLVESDGRLWSRAHTDDGTSNKHWIGWKADVLAPCDCKVEKIVLNDVTNLPGVLGKPPASLIILSMLDGTKIMLAHVRDISVSVGDQVKEGKPIARVGNNGYSRQPHIHLGAWRGDTPMQIRFDQRKFGAAIKKRGGQPLPTDDNTDLKAVFDADQSARSEEAMKSGKVPTIEEEKERRVSVFQMLAEGRVRTANDNQRALIVLHHTPTWEGDDGKTKSFSGENHLLAFFLAGRAHELGHNAGAHFLAWTYNYYLQGVGCSIDNYGFDLSDGRIRPKNDEVSAAMRLADCGYDPEPRYVELGLLEKSDE